MKSRFVVAALLLVLVPAVRAEAPKTDTPEQQVAYLEDALSEGFRTMDWKMSEMAIDGLKAAGVKGANAEISVLRAEREAAFDSYNTQRAQIETWGLVARAKLGDSTALAKLRARAGDEVAEVKSADNKLLKTNPAEFKAAEKAYGRYLISLQRKDAALLGLAIMKEPGVLDRALTALRNKKSASGQNQFYMMGGTYGAASDPLIEAALLADPQAGYKGLLEICNAPDDKVAAAVRSSVLQSLISMVYPPKYQSPDAPFTLEGDIAATLPKNAAAGLAKPYIAAIKAWKPDPKNAWDQNFFSLLGTGASFPVKTFDDDGIAAIRDVKNRMKGDMAQWASQTVDAVLKAQGVTVAAKPERDGTQPEKPPTKPQGDF
jgi:hypothetical protein